MPNSARLRDGFLRCSSRQHGGHSEDKDNCVSQLFKLGVFPPPLIVNLCREFEPDFLTAEDLSDGCGSKINVVIVSKKFEGVSRYSYLHSLIIMFIGTVSRHEAAGTAASSERRAHRADAVNSRIHHENLDP